MNPILKNFFDEYNVIDTRFESGSTLFKINDKLFFVRDNILNNLYMFDDRVSLIRAIQDCYHHTKDESINSHLVDKLGINSTRKVRKTTPGHTFPRVQHPKPQVIRTFPLCEVCTIHPPLNVDFTSPETAGDMVSSSSFIRVIS